MTFATTCALPSPQLRYSAGLRQARWLPNRLRVRDTYWAKLAGYYPLDFLVNTCYNCQ